jgi:hypothetical protein
MTFPAFVPSILCNILRMQRKLRSKVLEITGKVVIYAQHRIEFYCLGCLPTMVGIRALYIFIPITLLPIS